MKKDILHVVFICDENYVIPTVVAITSIYMHKNSDTICNIHILASDISEESKLKFQSLFKYDFEIEIKDMSHSSFLDKCKIDNLHVSTAALYKFNIANIFFNLDKILYLDGDILVQKDITELYSIDISDVYAAVVKDYKPMTYKPPQPDKLKINHSAYFNSGVMLLNLKKMREEDIHNQLVDYRMHGINYFMDQDALNVVFEEKVKYISLYYNVMSSVMGFFKTEDIKQYYELGKIDSKEDIYNNAVIVHLCTKYKPWIYSNVPFADEWLHCYRNSSFANNLERKELDRQTQKKIFAEIECKIPVRNWNIFNKVIVSLTSYPARIKFVPDVIESLLNQTVKVDKILLWLAIEQFPKKEQMLPDRLLKQLSSVVEIKWCDDIKPHKKYFYAMQQYPEDIIITVDDDVYYADNLVETLLNSYVKYPYAVSAMRAHLITFDDNCSIAQYSQWKRECSIVGLPSLSLLATGVGGVLYPPRAMNNELFNKNALVDTCINADDMWLKVMQVLNRTPVVIAAKPQKIHYLDGSQDTALWLQNDMSGANDVQLGNILDKYDRFWGNIDTVAQRIRLASLYFVKANKERKDFDNVKRKLSQTERELGLVYKSKSFRIGRFITYIPRKVRGGILCYKEHGLGYTMRRVKEKFSDLIGGSKK